MESLDQRFDQYCKEQASLARERTLKRLEKDHWRDKIQRQHHGWNPSSDQLTLRQAYEELQQFYKEDRPDNEHFEKLLPSSEWRPSSEQITLEQAYAEINQFYADGAWPRSSEHSEELLARKELAEAAVEAVSAAAAESGVAVVGDAIKRDAALLALRQGSIDNVTSVLRTTGAAAAEARYRRRVHSTETRNQRRLRLDRDAARKRTARQERDMVETPAMRTTRLMHEASLARDCDIANMAILQSNKKEGEPQAGSKRNHEDEEALDPTTIARREADKLRKQRSRARLSTEKIEAIRDADFQYRRRIRQKKTNEWPASSPTAVASRLK